MRGLVFLLAYLPLPFLSLVYPAVGVLAWAWLSFANPHREVYGFAFGQPYNVVIATATIFGALFIRREFRLRLDATFWLTFALACCLTISLVFSLRPVDSFPKWDENIKTLLLLVFICAIFNNKARVLAFMWIIALCLAYYGVKGGLLFIASGGRHHFTGPSNTKIGDRNTLALALVMVVPLLNFLRLISEWSLVRMVTLAAMGMTILAILGTYSRGGFLALLGMMAFLWWRSRQKIGLLIFAALVAVPAMTLVPESWTARMDTISEAQENDNSFRGRLVSWAIHANAALDRPLTGAGIWALQSGACFPYMPPEGVFGHVDTICRAAHSIYFEVLGDIGILGFIIYMALALTAWRNTQRTIRLARGRDDMMWMSDLARMIQVSFVGFFIGGAALSMAFYDVYLSLVAIAAVIRWMAESSIRQTTPPLAEGAGRKRISNDPVRLLPSVMAGGHSDCDFRCASWQGGRFKALEAPVRPAVL
jgi:putative inorganic carbon (hco3(-)) transporter